MATMSIDYQTLKFDYRPRAQDTTVHPVIVVGAGLVGLAAAIDLAQQGVSVVLLDDDDTLSTGSRAICFAKRTLEIFDRIGCGERFVDKGVSWHVGKVFLQDEQLYAFDLLPEEGHARPAFINLQQYYVEGYYRPRVRAAEHRHPLEAQGHGHRPVRRARGADDRNAGGRRDAARAVRDRGRRLAQPDAHDDGPRKPRPHVQGPFPDRRREDEGGVSDRALVLVRPAVSPESVGAAASPARQRMAHRLPARLGCRPRRREAAGARDPARACAARAGRRVRARMGERLYVPLPADGHVPARPRAVRGRFRARRVAVRRARREQRRAGCRQPRVETEARARRPLGRQPARHVCERARVRGRREHPQLDALDRLHHAEKPGVARVPR